MKSLNRVRWRSSHRDPGLGDACYRALLMLLPADLRLECGEDMIQLFRHYRGEAAGHPWRLVSLWLAAVQDVVRHAAAARAPRAPVRSHSIPFARPALSTLVADFRHGLRLLRRYPSTSLLAVATLALGIGANTAIFSVVDAVLLRTLPYPHPERLVMVWEKRPREGVMTNVVSPADYLDWRRLNTVFERIAAYENAQVTLTGRGDPIELWAGQVSAAFFDVLGVRPVLGRTFAPDEETRGKQHVVMLSHRLWQTAFGADASVVGRDVTLDGTSWRVIGVLPTDFRFLSASTEVWIPLALEGGSRPPSRTAHSLDVYARLKPGVTVAQAHDEMDRLGRQLEEQYPAANRGHGAHVVGMQDQFVAPVRASLIALFAAVGFVLLICCLNVASLLLARAVSRSREMAVRAALGASRGRLLTQAVVEGLALSVIGGGAGLGVAWLTLRALPLVMPARMSVVGLAELALDMRVLAFAFGLSLLTGVLFSVLPALQASRLPIVETLKQGGRGAAGVRRHIRLTLVVGEVTLAALTLMGAGLAIRSFGAVMSQPIGFDSPGRLALTVSLPETRYPSDDARRTTLDEIDRRLASVPGVRAVGAIDELPLAGDDRRLGVTIEGRQPTPESPTRMHPRSVTPTYFQTMGIPILRGRGFSRDDGARATPVAIISDTAARRFWPDDSPIGTRFQFSATDPWRTIVGISGDVRHWGLERPIEPMVYLPQAQVVADSLTFVLESDVDPNALVSAARAAVVGVDRNLPLADITALDALVSRSVRPLRAQTVLMGAFGALGLLLAVVGIYGVMAQLVSMRVQEIGIRMTLGARPVDVLRQLLVDGLVQTAVGLAIGLSAGAYLMHFAKSLLFGIAPWDVTTLGGVSLIVVGASLAACVVPARRAMKVDPAGALKQ